MWFLVAILMSILRAASLQGETTGRTTIPLAVPTKAYDPYSQNLTVVDMTPRSISLRWSCRNHHFHDKYEMTLKPLKATYRVIETVPRNSCYQTIENLLPDTDYQIFITLFTRNVRRRSNVLTVRTPMEEPEVELELDPAVKEEDSRELKMPQVKLVELSLVGLALTLWIVAIALFFHRWGKIRMLLPYQPDYKEKPVGSSCSSCVINPHHQFSHLPRLGVHDFHHGGGPIAGGICSVGALGLGLVSIPNTTESGCSPMRPRLNTCVPKTNTTAEIKIPADLRIYRKAKSAECLSPSRLHDDIQFIDF